MRNNLPCEVVQDLLPSYIDGLTSEKTNELVEEHVEGCDQCSSILRGMKSELECPIEIKEEEKKELSADIREVFSESKSAFSDIIKQPECREKNAMIKYAVFLSLKNAHFLSSGRGIRENNRKIAFEIAEVLPKAS